MRLLLQILAPILLVVLAVLVVFYWMGSREQPEILTPPPVIPWVEVRTVLLGEETPILTATGTLVPGNNLILRSELAGTIETLSPQFAAGMRVRRGELLLALETEPFAAVVAAREAEVAEARFALAEEIARGEQAVREWARLGREGEPGALTLRLPQREKAESRLTSAEAALALAERDLGKTRLVAPFDGVIAERMVAPGETLANPGAAVGRLVATEAPEVRLSLAPSLLALLEIPGATVEMKGAGALRLEGRIARVAPELETATRLAEVIVEVEPSGQTPPFGTFFTASLEGKKVAEAARLPRQALRPNDTMWVIDEDSRVNVRPVTILHRTAAEVIVLAGLRNGERVVVSPLPFFSEGMPVQVTDEVGGSASTATP